MTSALIVSQVRTKKDLKEFIRFPWEIYRNDAQWCPPFLAECKQLFSGKHPFNEYGTMNLFLARLDGKIVGRIGAITNKLHNEQHKENSGFFGFFESIDDQKVATELLDAAAGYLKTLGFDKMAGPASPTSNYDYGCQYEGFEFDQMLSSTHNRPYYSKLMENYGLTKQVDLFSYIFTKEVVGGTFLWEIIRKLENRTKDIQVRKLNKKLIKQEVNQFIDIYNKGWVANQNSVPLTEAEAKLIYDNLKYVLDPNLVSFAEVNGNMAGTLVFFPDYSRLFKSMNGKIYPWDLLRLMREKKKIRRARCIIAGVYPEYQNRSVFPIMLCKTMARIAEEGLLDNKEGYEIEAGYILENNKAMRSPIEKLGGKVYKKYRVYEIAI
jgi:hypothetical protein